LLLSIHPTCSASASRQEHEELATFHSIISSARASSGRGTREMEAFEISTRFELLDECSEMRGDGSREGVVLVLEALPNC